MRILITGMSGFTGGYVKAALEKQGHDVKGLTSNLFDTQAISAELSAIKPQAVIHLAAIAFVAYAASPADFYQVNLIGTFNLLQALTAHSSTLKSVLLVSSANIYGNNSNKLLDENAPPSPTNDYAASKLAMEYMAKLWMERLPVFIVRPFNYTGVGQSEQFLIPKIVAHFRRKVATIELGNLDIWREFGDVRQVADTYRKLLELAPVGEIINVCTRQAYSLREVLTLATQFTDHQPRIIINPDFQRKNEIRHLVGDNTRLIALIGESASLPFSETLRWMLNDNR